MTCCTPIRKPFPSGWAWAHARSCSAWPGQKLTPARPVVDTDPAPGVHSPQDTEGSTNDGNDDPHDTA